MARITNNLRSTVNLVTGVKDGVAVTEAIRASETKEVKADTESAHFKGLLAAGAISVDDKAVAKAARAATE
jgi:hypothetical protein